MPPPQSTPSDGRPLDRDEIATEYFDALPYPPYPVQEEALLAYFASDDDTHGVLVCAPTGTGKTMIAEGAVYEALRTGRRMYYTTPLIALTDQKLDELRQSAVRWGFSADDVGLVTGNRSVNPDAKVLVVVAEILLNRLLAPEQFSFADVDSVVMDEFHSFNDRERGIVWELSLQLLPLHVRVMLLSATVGNAVDFTSWLYRSHARRLQLVSGTERKVPLQYEWIDDEILADFAVRIADGDEDARRVPSLLFSFSRAQCWTTGELLRGKPLIDKARQSRIAEIVDTQDMSAGAGPKLRAMLLRGVGVHHAGVLPRYRRIVETLFQEKLLAYCVCTETLAAGINLPARSVVLPTILKGPRDRKKLIETAQAQQIFGRAGRPQYDDRGYVFALAHEDDVKLNKWREKFDQIPEDTKDPGLLKARKQLKKKMPKRRSGETYWTAAQFEQLQNAAPADLKSRGRLPWRLIAYLLHRSPDVAPLREMVGKRLLNSAEIEVAQKDLTRMLVTLSESGHVTLEPPPSAAPTTDATPTSQAPDDKDATSNDPAALLSGLLGGGPPPPSAESSAAASTPTSSAVPAAPKIDFAAYRPVTATPTAALPDLIRLKTVQPIWGNYVAEKLAVASELERVAVLESLLEVPGSVAKFCRVPDAEELPPGPLTTDHLDPQLLQLGLATPEELGAKSDEDEDDRDRWNDGPRVWPLTIGEKLLRLFRHDHPRVDDVRVSPVWIVGRLIEFDFDFAAYVTAAKLQKEEGILFRHCLRMVLLLDEMASIPPKGTTPETWEDPLDLLAERLTDVCRTVDPQSTDEIVTRPDPHTDPTAHLIPTRRRT